MSIKPILILAAAASLFAAVADSAAHPATANLPYMIKNHEVRMTADVKFGIGGIEFTKHESPARYRELLLDIYEPVQPNQGLPRPALILAFGGAYQRGTRKDDFVDEGGHSNTSISEYCREFARRGYVCFSIDYRLMPEDPDPGVTPTIPPGAQFDFERINVVRGLMKLPPTNLEAVVREMEAATDDMSRAVYFVRAQSKTYNIDVNRIAIGGFSAGANTALNTGFAERAPVAAVVALSGAFAPSVVENFIGTTSGEPALLLYLGENDLPDLLADLPTTEKRLKEVGAASQIVRIPGAGHFYPRTSSVIAADGSKTTVEELMAGFLYDHLKLAANKKSPVK